MSDTNIAVYIRLSSADEDIGRGKRESDSIVNQRSLIHGYLDRHAELSGCPRTEFVDDGFTGTNTDRPAFQEMIRQIREGKYNLCITKDFSRFARDYIEMGDYLECLFPFLKVRYISINDGYDSEDYKGTTGGLDVVMRTIVYDAYSKDLSVKCKTGRRQNMKKGRRTSGFPGYGYKKDPERKCMDVVDPEAAAVVRRIFEAAISGMSPGRIASMLNGEEVLTPSAYFRQKNPDTKKYQRVSEKQRWDYGTVYVILKRYTYTGASVGGIREQVAPCSKTTVKKNFEDWIIVPDMHEAIISAEEYELAQKVLGKDPFKNRRVSNYALKSLVVCGNCLRRMHKHQSVMRYYCKHSENGGDKGCKGIRSPKEADMEKIVFKAIRDYMGIADDKCRDMKKKRQVYNSAARSDRQSIEVHQRQVQMLKKEKFQQYEQYSTGNMSKEAYLSEKARIDADMIRHEEAVREIQQRIDRNMGGGETVGSELEAVCHAFHDAETLTYEMAHAFIDKILVYPDDRIEIVWRFLDCLSDEREEARC